MSLQKPDSYSIVSFIGATIGLIDINVALQTIALLVAIVSGIYSIFRKKKT